MNFGDGVTFGKSPVAGSKIIVNYLSTSGSVANGGSTFTANNSVTVLDKSYSLNVTTITKYAVGTPYQARVTEEANQ